MEISEAHSSLIAAQAEWRHLLYEHNFIRKESELVWKYYDPDLCRTPTTPEQLVLLYERGQYSFCFRDGSLAQLHYRFGPASGALSSARLSFYRRLPDEKDSDSELPTAPESPELEAGVLPLDAPPGTVEWLRLDFDPRAASTLVHPACHLHVGGLSEVRIGVEGVPTPRQFLEFVVHAFYPDQYLEARTDEQGALSPPDALSRVNQETFSVDASGHGVLHLRVPGLP
jgi:hypothetical protein